MKLPAGTSIYIGAPGKPMPSALSSAIGAALGKLPEIREAHLPQVYVQGKIDPPAQILVLVFEEGTPNPSSTIADILHGILPAGLYLDFFLWLPNNPLLATVRDYGCKLDLHRRED